MSRKTLEINNQVYDYMMSVSLRESPILNELRQETAKHPLSNMQIAPEQGQFFSLLIKALRVVNAIEIGVFTGYSSLAIALALPENGKLIACDTNEETTKVAQEYWRKANVEHKVDLHIGPAIDTLDKLLLNAQANSFDFGFIDAHKPEYIEYYERLLKLIRPGGIIAIDNVLWSGHVANRDIQDEDTIAIREFNQHLHDDDRVDISLLPIADGITLALKK